MRCNSRLVASFLTVALACDVAGAADFGRPATAEEIKLWDIDVRPDGAGLPPGSGTAAHGKEVFDTWCQGCHGANGQGGIKDRLVGGQGTLASDKPIKTIGSFWPYASTLFDYIRRAMPYPVPGTLSDDDVYSVTAYLLSLNGVLAGDATLDAQSLLKITMPNHDGFVPDRVFELYNERTGAHEPIDRDRGHAARRKH